MNEASEQFVTVRDDISRTVGQAQDEVKILKNSSMEVETRFGEMGTTFTELQESVEQIKQRMSRIVSIADQTNILAINASIEAARAGEKGKGFAVVAMEVKKLADEIKDLAAEVDSGLKDVEKGTDKLSDSIDTSRQALGQSLDKVEETYKMFDKITFLKWESVFDNESWEEHRNLILEMTSPDNYKILIECTNVGSFRFRGNGQISGFYIKDMSVSG